MKTISKLIFKIIFTVLFILTIGCNNDKKNSTGDQINLHELGRNYTHAWNSQKPENVASFFAEKGSLTVNGGAPIIGREAITKFAEGFMSAFLDMILTMDSVATKQDQTEYHWTFSGTNDGPGGTGNKVLFSGFESWQLNAQGLIRDSQGHFDADDYNRQLKGGGNYAADKVAVKALVERFLTVVGNYNSEIYFEFFYSKILFLE
jgi:uncharacterized protein (TIGR02246 family)